MRGLRTGMVNDATIGKGSISIEVGLYTRAIDVYAINEANYKECILFFFI